MSIFMDSYDRQRFILTQANVLMAGILSCPPERYEQVLKEIGVTDPSNAPFDNILNCLINHLKEIYPKHTMDHVQVD